MQILLNRTQAGPGRTVKLEQEENSPNHVQRINLLTVPDISEKHVSVNLSYLCISRRIILPGPTVTIISAVGAALRIPPPLSPPPLPPSPATFCDPSPVPPPSPSLSLSRAGLQEPHPLFFPFFGGASRRRPLGPTPAKNFHFRSVSKPPERDYPGLGPVLEYTFFIFSVKMYETYRFGAHLVGDALLVNILCRFSSPSLLSHFLLTYGPL